jgi:dTDP-4-amino-4,6-dideoxygalactose transaminase
MALAPRFSVPAARYQAHKTEIDKAMARVFRSGRFILGEQVAAFEKEFAAFLGANHCIGVGSGTDALELALRACGIGSGDAVLTVAHTAVATVAAIGRAGAFPVLVDIDPATFTMDAAHLERTMREYTNQGRSAMRPRLRAVIPVHLYGHPADMPAVLSLARSHRLRVIEDCAQSHGASLAGKPAGTWGNLAAFSFYPTNNLGAFGDGGAVVTNDSRLGAKVRLLREYGWTAQSRDASRIPGMNSRLDELQAAILRLLLKHLSEENNRRRELAAEYARWLAGAELVLPQTSANAVHVFHQYVVRTPRRERLREALESNGFPAQVHYPVPVHRQPAYRRRVFIPRGGLPNTDAAARQVLSLPISPHFRGGQIKKICDVIRAALGRTKAL